MRHAADVTTIKGADDADITVAKVRTRAFSDEDGEQQNTGDEKWIVTVPGASIEPDVVTDVALSLDLGESWELADGHAADRWLDARDSAILRQRELSGENGMLQAVTAVRADGRTESSSDEPDITAVVRDAEELGVPVPPEAVTRAGGTAAAYPRARLGDREIVVQGETGTVPRVDHHIRFLELGASNEVGLLRVSVNAPQGEARVEAVSVSKVETIATPASPAALGGGSSATSLRVTTTELRVTSSSRPDLQPFLALVNDGWRTGRFAIPPNLFSPTEPVGTDPIQHSLYTWSTVGIQERNDHQASGKATTLPLLGLPEGTGGVRKQPAVLELQQRSNDGHRREFREVTC